MASTLGSQYNLHDIFIMPVQRLPRYMLLLEAAAAAMPPSDPGAAALKGAVEAVRAVVSAVNEGKRDADNFEKVA